MRQKINKMLAFLGLLLIESQIAYAEATSKEEIEFFLEGLGGWLIQSVGPGVFVIGLILAGVSVALGNEQGMKQGALAMAGGAIIMLSRSALDLLKSLTGF